MSTFSLWANGLLLAAALLALIRSRVLGASVLGHYFSSHGTRVGSRHTSAVVAELAAVVAMNIGAVAYADSHRKHHGLKTFATLADPDALFLYNLGFRPGRSLKALRGLFFLTLFSWRLHGPMAWSRLKATFGAQQPAWRRLAAFGYWGALVVLAAASDHLTGLLTLLALGLGVGAQAASFIQLCSEHRWMISAPQGMQRQRQLSHARTLIGWLPLPGACWWRWLGVPIGLLAAVLVRATIWVGDLAAHDRHHLQMKPQLGIDQVGWTNSTYEFADDQHEPRNHFASLRSPIDAWLQALSQEAPVDVR
jgi:hypothetical protein